MRVIFALLTFILLTAACTTTALEPASSDNFTGEVAADVVTVPPRPTQTPKSIAPTRTTPPLETTPIPGSSATPIPLPTTLTLTPWPPDPIPTPTPVPPSPGMLYTTEAGLWEVDTQWQPSLLTSMTNILDVNGRSILFLQDDDIWLWNLASDVQTNISNTPGGVECGASFWDGHPHKIFYQQRLFVDGEPSGFCSDDAFLHNTQTEATVTLATGDVAIMADVAGSPNGRFFAYDLNGTELWLYDDEEETAVQLNPADYNFPQDTIIERLGSPSWSPDGQRLAIIMAIQPPNEPRQIILGIFDLTNKTFAAYHPYQNFGRDGWFSPAQWSPTGEFIAFIAEDMNMAQMGIWVINIQTGTETLIPQAFNPLWSPDGEFLHYQAFGEDGQSIQPYLTYPPDFTYKIGVFLPAEARLLSWQTQN